MNDPLRTLDALAVRAESLYSLPAVAMKALELTRDPEVDNGALKECIENDPALTAKLLKVVNSSLFGLSRKVSDLGQALALLGTKPLKLLVLGFSLPPSLCEGVQIEVLRRYWRHTLTKAVACRKLAEQLYRRPGDEAFLAGLLQDLGILLLIQELGENYTRFLDKANAQQQELAAVERRALGFDHTMLTARLLTHWNLPPALVEAIACGAAPEQGRGKEKEKSRSGEGQTQPSTLDPQPSPPPPLRHVLKLGELLARFLADGHTRPLDELLAVDPLVPSLTHRQLEAMLDETLEQVGQLADALALELPGGLQYEALLARAHRQLSAVAADAASDLVWQEQASDTLDVIAESLAAESGSLCEAVRKAAVRTTLRRTPSTALSTTTRTAGRNESPAAGSLFEQPAAKIPAAAEPDPGLIGQLARAVTACRQVRRPLSILLVALNDPDALLPAHGVAGFERLCGLLRVAAAGLEHPGMVCLPHGEGCFAVIVPGCERSQAVHLATELADGFRRTVRELLPGGGAAVGISLGVASVSAPSKNFPAENLFHAADRCLYASRASGGVVKSIEIY